MDAKIIADLRRSLGVTFQTAEPVSGGWLNRKWKIDGPCGPLLVKQYSLQRYRRPALEQIEQALQRQLLLPEDFPAPRLLTCGGRVLQMPDDQTVYMAMEFRPGRIVGPENVSLSQLRSLGDALGRIHRAFSALPAEGARGWPMDSRTILEDLHAHCCACADSPGSDAPEALRRAVAAQPAILESLSAEYLDRLPRGIGHEDFTPDNMLFDDGGVTAILDFDRSQYGFRWHDVGRAMLSLALTEDGLDMDRVRALLDGYAAHMPMPDGADALRVCWCVEAPWWIHSAAFREPSPKVARFRREICWVAEHWFRLDEICGS